MTETRMSIAPIASAVVQALIGTSGCSVSIADPAAPAPSDGFVVSLPGAELVLVLKPDAADVSEWWADRGRTVADAAAALGHRPLVGVWEDHGRWYLDVSVHVEGLSEAITIAERGGQLAIWDAARAEPIVVDSLLK
jgi:hypothetical protein